MFGHPLNIPVPDLDRTDYLLMLGANPYESNGSLAPPPTSPAASKRSGPAAARWSWSIPGAPSRRPWPIGGSRSDPAPMPAFLLALAQVLFEEASGRPRRARRL